MLEDIAICISALDWWSLYASFLPESIRPELPVSQFDFEEALIAAAKSDAMTAMSAMRDADQFVQQQDFDQLRETVLQCETDFGSLAD